MRRIFLLLAIAAYASCKPQKFYESDRPAPGQLQAYVKFTPANVRELKTRGYALPLVTASPIQYPSGFRSTISPVDNSVASSQRRPYDENENYPVQNSIQQQQRPQQGRRPPPQHFTRQQLEEVISI